MQLFTNAIIWTGEGRFFQNGAVIVENGKIIQIGDSVTINQQAPPGIEIIDLEGKLMMPGLVCSHAHFYGAFSRGMGLKVDEPPSKFLEILKELWWRLDKALDNESTELSALIYLVDAIKSGTTTIIDHHSSPTAIPGSLDELAKATVASGVRASLCYEVSDRDGEDAMKQGILENIRFIKRAFDIDTGLQTNPLLSATFGLHAAFTLSEETLSLCKEAVEELPEPIQRRVGFHIHVAEDSTDPTRSLEQYGIRTVQRLDRAGILNENTILGHCLDVDESEIDIIAKRGCSVVHNPESNMNNGVGVSNVSAMLDAGIQVGLGTDGITYDMFQESKTVYFVHKLEKKDPRAMGGDQLMQVAIKGSSEIASKGFDSKVGILIEGGFADMAILDYDPPTTLSAGNFPWHLVFGMSSNLVRHTIVGGRFLMKNRVIETLDVENIMKRARDKCPQVWERF